MLKHSSGKNNKNIFYIFLLLTFFYAFMIFYFSSFSKVPGPETIFYFIDMKTLKRIAGFFEENGFSFILYIGYPFYKIPDKVEHFILYSGLGFLIYMTLKRSNNAILQKYAFIFAIIIGLIYGATDEIHQHFVPGRSTSMWDLAADGAGVITVQLFVFIKNKILPFL